MTEVGSGVARTRDGIEIGYTVRRNPSADAPRCVLVHSLALDRSVWAPVGERLAENWRVATYDCRGHGVSTRAAGPYSLDLFADDLAALLDTLGWPSAIVAGASMGGSVAQAFAVKYPARVTALGLVDTTAWYGPEAPEQWETRARQAQERSLASLIDFQLGRWFGDEFRTGHPDLMKHLLDVFVANNVECYAASCRMLGAFDLRAALERLRVPVAVIVGEEDYATPPAMARTIQAAVTGASLDVLPGARHLSLLERPDDVAAILAGLAERAAALAAIASQS